MVRKSVEETLNELLNKEAEELTSAAKYERTEARQGYRSGHYSRKLITTSGEEKLNIPKLKGVPFETAIIERYRRRESSIEEALIKDIQHKVLFIIDNLKVHHSKKVKEWVEAHADKISLSEGVQGLTCSIF